MRFLNSLSALTRVQRTILFVAWLGWVSDVMDTALFNFAKVPMVTEMLGAARYQIEGPRVEGQIQTWFLMGWALGGLVFGILADRWGRTHTLIATILLYCAFTGLTALCHTPNQVIVVRFLTALGIGGEWAAGAALVAESMPDEWRGRASSVLQSAAAFGPVFAALANLGLASYSWRALFVVGIAPAFICFLIRNGVPEPPRTARPLPQSPFGMIRELFGVAKWRRNAIVAMALGVVGVTGAGILPFWLPNLVRVASMGLAESVMRARTTAVTMSLHIGTLLGVFAFPWIANRFGRRPAFASFFALALIATAAALFGGASFIRLMVLTPVAAFFAIGVSAGFVLYFPELFPTHLRATGSGLAYNVGRVFSAPIPWLTGLAMGLMNGSIAAGCLIASSIFLLGLIVVPFAPETRGAPLPEN